MSDSIVPSGASQNNSWKFPNPFFDIASTYMPNDMTKILEWSEYLYLTMGTYRAASRRIVRYFLTELVLEGESENEREDYEEFLNDELHLLAELAQIGDDFMCFHGDTPVVTRTGIYPIRSLEGETVDVLSKDGVYRKAEFKSFGVQELLEVEFSDGRTVLATPEHQWHVRKSAGGLTVVPTTKLAGRAIPRTVAPRPAKGDEFEEGVRHGFVFGDGSIYNKHRKNPRAVANFFDAKNQAVRPYFEGHGRPPRTYHDGRLTKIHGLPLHYRQLPANEASAEYWYGFLCGFMAADGHVDKWGCASLAQVSKSTLEAVAAQLPRLGMVGGPVREYQNDSRFVRDDGTIDEFSGMISVLNLYKQFMLPGDFLIPAHRASFEAREDTEYGNFLRVRSVKRTGIVDQVYCCVEPETHTFVIGSGVLTGNCYGNVFISLYFPFERFLICPKCSTTYHNEAIDYKFEYRRLHFNAECRKCGYRGPFGHEDRRSPDHEQVKIIRWNPKQMKMRVHPVSGSIEYFWELPGQFMAKLKDGNKFYVQDMPWSILSCLKPDVKSQMDTKDVLFKFSRNSIYHLRETTLAGIPVVGWGIPPILPNFKLAYYIQVLRRFDEAIALDFIVPHRVIYPEKTSGGADPLMVESMNKFVGIMQNMIKKHRADPTTIQVAPFPIGYKMLGGEGNALTPKDQIGLAIDELLNASGFPAELYKGSLSIQAFPVALRLFEKTWGSWVAGCNDLISWILKRISRHFMWGEMSGKLRSVTLADDIERKALALQAAAGMDISKATAYKPFAIDYMEEQKRVVEEQQAVAKLQQEAMAEQEAQQGLEGAAPGGGGGAGEMGMGATPGDVYQQAQQLAQQLLFQTPEGLRRGELIKIKHSNPTLHALVLQQMDELRQEMSRQGGAAMTEQTKQQMQGQGGAMVAQASAKDAPSPMLIGILVADQVLGYSHADLIKLGHNAATGSPIAKQAFHFVYAKMRGWE